MSKFILTDDQLRAIGCVALESTYAEQLIEQLTWRLCSIQEEQGKFFTDRMPFDRRLDLLSDLWKPMIKDKKRLLMLTKILADLKEANGDRNTIIHGNWTYSVSAMVALSELSKGDWKKPPAVAIKRRLRSDSLQSPAVRIQETASRISELTNDLYEFAQMEGLHDTPA